ncbi:N/A [soil metagenome]
MSAPDEPAGPVPGGPAPATRVLSPADLGGLLAHHRLAALRVATVVLGAAEGADDVVQDATERALRAVATYDAALDVRPWFFHIVANVARNQRRSRGRRAALALRASSRREVTETTGASHATPEDVVVSDDDRRLVNAALNRLGSDDRLVIALRHFEELSEQEMAVAMDCPTGTVKSRLSRAMSRLRRELTEDEERARA